MEFEIAGYRYQARVDHPPDGTDGRLVWVVTCQQLGQTWVLPGEARPDDGVRQVQRRLFRLIVRQGNVRQRTDSV